MTRCAHSESLAEYERDQNLRGREDAQADSLAHAMFSNVDELHEYLFAHASPEVSRLACAYLIASLDLEHRRRAVWELPPHDRLEAAKSVQARAGDLSIAALNLHTAMVADAMGDYADMVLGQIEAGYRT